MTSPTNQRPNIICIMPDDTDFSWLSCYGGRTPTPAIDSIANDGMRFDEMYCSASACTPSRYSYLTGHYGGRCPDAHFLKQNPADAPYNIGWNTVLNRTMPSVSRVLQAHGYRTGISGKWHCGRPRNELGLPQFAPDADLDDPKVNAKLQTFQAGLAEEVRQSGGFDYANSIVWGNNESFPIRTLQEHNLEWITKGALEFLDGCADDQPFFLYVTPTAFHGPPHEQSYAKDISYTQGGKRADLEDIHPPRATMHTRLAERGLPYNHDTVGITWLDDQVAVILAKLDAMGVADNTIVIFKIDHNTETGKGTCHRCGTHIPMILRWPGVVEPGTVCNARVINVDFAPFIFDVTGITPPDTMPLDGTSWLPLLTGDEDSIHADLFFEFGYARGVLAGKWNYIALRYPQSLLEAMANGTRTEAPNHIDKRLQGQMNIAIETYPHYFDPDQLFDTETDPDELHNLADDPAYAAVLADMQARLQKHTATFAHPFDLSVPDFMRSEQYQALCDETRKIGTGYLSWWPKDVWWK